jgi:hypothetical protein
MINIISGTCTLSADPIATEKSLIIRCYTKTGDTFTSYALMVPKEYVTNDINSLKKGNHIAVGGQFSKLVIFQSANKDYTSVEVLCHYIIKLGEDDWKTAMYMSSTGKIVRAEERTSKAGNQYISCAIGTWVNHGQYAYESERKYTQSGFDMYINATVFTNERVEKFKKVVSTKGNGVDFCGKITEISVYDAPGFDGKKPSLHLSLVSATFPKGKGKSNSDLSDPGRDAIAYLEGEDAF